MSKNLLSHIGNEFNLDLDSIKSEILSNPNLTISHEQAFEIVDQLTQFELGKSLLYNRGLSGYWISYVILHGINEKNLSELEWWILNKSPVVLATRERFQIFQLQIQKLLKSNITIASIPCGLMETLLTLDYSKVNDVSITGIDLDTASLVKAQELARKSQLKEQVEFIKSDAWDLNIKNKFDIVISNGLTIYESDDNKVTQLYHKFFNSLRSDGTLITSFLTPPPIIDKNCCWKNYSPQDLAKQKLILSDIIRTKWQCYRSHEATEIMLKKAGFDQIRFIDDTQSMFPTVIATK